MILNYVSSAKPLAAQVTLDPCDDESVLLPLCPKTQEAWHRRSVENRDGFNPVGFLIVKGEQMYYNKYGILN